MARPAHSGSTSDWRTRATQKANTLRARSLTPSVAWTLLHPALWPTFALLALYAAFYLQFAGSLISFPFDFDQGEGYDAWSAWLIDRGELPYTSNQAYPYYSSNYPPVWSYLVSIPMAWLGPGLAPARAVATAAGLFAAIVIGLAARRRANITLAGLLAGGLFLASPYVFHTTPLARVNGTTLLLSLVALSLFEAPTRRRVALGTLVVLAALFTKQTAIDAALACLLSTFCVKPRRAIAAGFALVGFGLAGLAALSLATRGAFWLNVISGNANPFDVGQLVGYLNNFARIHGAVLAVAGVEIVVSARRRDWSPWVFYLPTSLALALGVGKWGAGESYFLGAIASACVLAAALVARLLQTGRVGGGETRSETPPCPAYSAWLLGAALLTQGLLLAHGPLTDIFPLLRDRGPQASLLGRPPSPADRIAGEEITAMIRRVRGPALVEDPSFAVSAGKPVVGNATHLRNLHQAGLWDPTSLVAELKARRYGIVVLNAQLYPEPILQAIGRAYYRDRTVRMNGYTYQVFLPGSE